MLEAFRNGLPEPGLYLFPGEPGEDSPEAMAAWEQQYRTGPTGLLAYRPVGGEFSFPRHLSLELLTNILAAFLAALVLARISGTYLSRALLVAGLGIFAWLSVSVSYWIWYGFPSAFILGEGLDQLLGWLVAGLVIAKVVPGTRSA
ncbi:MAG TPA: hypothetical protein VMW27_28880 [Thermoanaerobaculia bacterium]|nr:hypothetical protein [Thermoanaerobaculia bacterium]